MTCLKKGSDHTINGLTTDTAKEGRRQVSFTAGVHRSCSVLVLGPQPPGDITVKSVVSHTAVFGAGGSK